MLEGLIHVVLLIYESPDLVHGQGDACHRGDISGYGGEDVEYRVGNGDEVHKQSRSRDCPYLPPFRLVAAPVTGKHRKHAQHQCQPLGVEGGVEEAAVPQLQEHLYGHGMRQPQVSPESVCVVIDIHREDAYPYDDEGRVGLLVFRFKGHRLSCLEKETYLPDKPLPFGLVQPAQQEEDRPVCDILEFLVRCQCHHELA